MTDNTVKWWLLGGLGVGILYLLFKSSQLQSANDSSMLSAVKAVLDIPGEVLQSIENDAISLWGAGDDLGDGSGPSIGNPTF